ncbi:helix-turn-helix transcriptional regulator [Alsobacter sp. SYSU BS001988]
MSRAERLLDLLQALRRRRYPAAGAELATELGVSLRTLYRDVASLRAQGAPIEGEAGLGFVLRHGFLLPPLMFSPEELEALALGARWAADRGDRRLRGAALDALAKIGSILPRELADELDGSRLLVGPSGAAEPSGFDPALVRDALRRQSKLRIAYRDKAEAATSRTVWPLAVGYFDRAQVLVAWCELRADFRCFRLDRIAGVEALTERYSSPRKTLLRQWREREGVAEA